MEKNFDTNNENAIEFLTGDKYMTVTFTQRKYITKIMKLHDSDPNEFLEFNINQDGSVCAKVPLTWLKISLPKKISEEQRQAASERFRKLREDGKL